MKHKLTRLTSLFLALIMSFSMLLVPANAAFSDVPEKAWYAEAVDYVQAHEWMKGVSENSFAPNAEVTRAMFVTVLARYAKANVNDEQTTKFDDVPSGTWYTGAVAWAAEKGIVNGVSANAFAPNRAISRQELCTMLARFINKQGYELKEGEAKSFTDAASIAGFAKDAVAYCARTGLVAGYTDGSFRPTATASRAMTATLLMRLDKSIQGENEDPIPMPARTLSSEVDGLTVTVDAPEGALPADAEMTVTKIENLNAVQAAVDALEDVQGTALVAADITFFHEGEEIQPKKDVTVTMTSAELPEEGELAVVHLDTTAAELEESEVEAEPVDDVTVEPNAVSFDVDSFSVYAVIGDVIIDKDEDTLTFETDAYDVTVTYTKEAQIPAGTRLTVSEIPFGSEEYFELREAALAKLNENAVISDSELVEDTRRGIADAIFVDVSLEYNDQPFEPTVPLDVKIVLKQGSLFRPAGEDAYVVHFGAQGTELIEDVSVTENAVSENSGMPAGALLDSFDYEQTGFSVVGLITTDVYINFEAAAPASGFITPEMLLAPIVRADGDPTINAGKTVTDNDGDGIYELALSINATSKSSSTTSVTKSNVVMVIDVSGSMGNNNSYVYYDTYTYDANTYNQFRYYNSNTNQNRQLFYGTFYDYDSTPRYQQKTGWYYVTNNNSRYHAHTGTVYAYETRLHATQRAACAVVDALLAYNVNSDNITDVFEITVVKFAERTAHDGYNGTETVIRDSTSATAIKNAINGLTAAGGTHWRAALEQALTEANYFKNTDPSRMTDPPENTSVIFLTDGFPTERGTGNDGGSENNENVSRGYLDARTPARNIVAGGFTLYNIFAYGNDTTTYGNTSGQYNTGSHTGFEYLRGLANYAYGSGTTNNFNETATTRQYCFNAKSTQQLVDAFKTIIDHITNNVGFAGVSLTDGVSLGATSTSVAVNGTAKPESMRYTVKDASGKISYTVAFSSSGAATFTIYNANGTTTTKTDDAPETVTTTINDTTITSQVYSVTVGEGESAKTYKMSPATIDGETGLVKWDLAGLGILESGYTYTVAFDVWPNQLAYDIAADLNNGIYANIDAALTAYGVTDATERQHIKDAIVHNADGSYSIYTNYEQSVEYYPATSETDDSGNVTWTYGDKQQSPIPQPNPVPLQGSSLPLRKDWESGLSPAELNELLWKDGVVGGTSNEYHITLKVWKADTKAALEAMIKPNSGAEPYITEVLGWDATENKYIFEREAAVAPGRMVNLAEAQELGYDITDETKLREFTNDQGTKLTYYVIEEGHYYYVTEEGADLHFELESPLYHPMIVDGTLYNVFFGEGKAVERMDPMYAVVATNYLKGGLNVRKVVTDFEGTIIPDVEDEFAFILTIWNEDEDGTISPVYTYDDQFKADNTAISGSIGYREFGKIKNEATGERETLGRNVIIFEDTLNAPQKLDANKRGTNDPVYATKTADNKTQIILRMPANGEIRLVNLPSDTKYTVKEILDLADGYYLIGPNGWSVYDILPNQMFVPNSSNPGEYMLSTTLTEGDEFKVVEVKDGNINAWYPGGDSANYHVNATGPVTIYFRSSYNDGWAQNGGYFWVGNPVEAPAPDDSETVYTYFKTESYLKGKVEDPEGEGSSSGEVAEVLTGTTTANTVSGSITGNKANIETYYNKTKAVFYVYHSSDNTVEKISFSDNRVKSTYDAENNKYVYTFSIYDDVYPSTVTIDGTSYDVKFLYGGYYHDYKGKSTDFDALTLQYENNKSKDDDGEAYTLDYIKTSAKQAWKDCDPYTENGKEMVPVQNTVYYLKEVPTAYLQPYTYYTYNIGTYEIKNLWTISALDDLNYSDAGFYIEDVLTHAKNVVSSLSIRAANSTTTVKLTAYSAFNSRCGMQDGYLSYVDSTNDIGKKINIRQYWTTIDGVEVFGFVQRQLDTTSGITSEIVVDDTPYPEP